MIGLECLNNGVESHGERLNMEIDLWLKNWILFLY